MTADGRVPPERPQVGFQRLIAGAPVRAQQWLDAAYLGHWIAGRGQVVVPGHSCRYGLTGAVTMHYRVPLSGRAIARVACVGVRSNTGAAASVTVTMGSGSTTAVVGPLVFGGTIPIYVQDDGVTRTSAATDIDITVTGTAVFIESCTVWEVPRAALSRDATDLGIAMDTLFPRRPIVDSGSQSVRAVAALMKGVDGRRIGHFARWGEGLGTTSGAFVSAVATPYRVLPRAAEKGATKRAIRVYLRGRVTVGGTTGEWKVVAGSGASATGTITGTSAAWQGFVDVLVMCEDPSTANGLQGGAYDTLDVQARRTAGGGQVLVESWNAVEFE